MIKIREGLKMLRRASYVKRNGFNKYSGNDEEICRTIIDDCWNGKFFSVSNGHFSSFYSRDFSWVVKSLIILGYKDKVKKTLDYALSIFKRYGHIFVAINDQGKPFDFPIPAIDSLPSIIKSMVILNDRELIKKYQRFIQEEAERLFNIATENGLVTTKKHFSSIKDHSKRKSSCYDNCMIGMLAIILKKLGIKTSFDKYDYKELIQNNFWTGNSFKNDYFDESITGDSNIFPFWTGLFDDKEMLRNCIESIENEKLHIPFPLKYHQKNSYQKMNFYNLLVSDYETDSIWMHIGLLYVDVLSRINKKKAKSILGVYKDNIDRFKTFLEVYDKNGKPFKSFFYITDEAMIWVAKYLELKKKIML